MNRFPTKDEFDEMIETFSKMSQVAFLRRLELFFILVIFAAGIADFLETPDSALTRFLTVLGVGGWILFLGVSMLCFLPESSSLRRRWKTSAVGSIIIGALFLLLGFATLIGIL